MVEEAENGVQSISYNSLQHGLPSLAHFVLQAVFCSSEAFYSDLSYISKAKIYDYWVIRTLLLI